MARCRSTPRPGDTANDIILRARAAAADAENLAKTDPLKAMNNEMRKVEAAVKRELAATRKPDPLAFLNESTVGANKAVDRILGDPDLIVAASRAFPGGEKSSEFQLLRQVWTQRFLSETLEPGERLAATSKEIQELMFPGDHAGRHAHAGQGDEAPDVRRHRARRGQHGRLDDGAVRRSRTRPAGSRGWANWRARPN